MVTKLQNAYDTISDPTKRREYDLRWPSIRDGLRARQESEKRQAEATQAEAKRAAEARVKKQQEDRARDERLRNLEQNRWKYNVDIFELSRVIRKLEADLKRLKEQDDEDARKEKERNGWWAYLTSPIYGQVKETEEQKQERENKRLQRNAAKRIKGSDLVEKEARLRNLQDALRGVENRIAAEKRKVEEEERARKLKMEQEARDRAMREERERMAKRQKERDEQAARMVREARERVAKWQRERAEQAAKEAREAQAAQEAWEAQERERVAQARERAAAAAEQRRRREAKIRAEATRRTEEAMKTPKKAPKHRSGRATQSTCRHDGWWPKVEGRQLCGKCNTFQNRFLLQCPGCQMVACASCQKSLRGGGTWKGKSGGVTGRQYGFGGNDEYDWDEIPSYDYEYD